MAPSPVTSPSWRRGAIPDRVGTQAQEEGPMSFDQPIEDHGIIGDLHTVALVGRDGAIDLPTMFASLLDAERGGRFQLAPESHGAAQKQLYLPDSNILLTRSLFDEGVGEVSDFMAAGGEDGVQALVRRAKTVRGRIAFRMLCAPRFDYGRAGHRVERRSDRELLFTSDGTGGLAFVLRRDVPLDAET